MQVLWKFLCAVALRKRSVQVALRKCCRSFREVLRTLVFYLKIHHAAGAAGLSPRNTFVLKVAICQPELRPRTTFALKSCDFCLEKLLRTRRGSNRGFIGHFANSHGAAATALRPRRSPQGLLGHVKNRKRPQFFNIGHADLRRGSRAYRSEIARSPQFFNVDHADPRRGLVFVEYCRPYPAALRREERNLKLLS